MEQGSSLAIKGGDHRVKGTASLETQNFANSYLYFVKKAESVILFPGHLYWDVLIVDFITEICGIDYVHK